MANKTTTIHVIHEIEGGSLVRAFTAEEDAKNYFVHECAAGNLEERYYKISPLPLEDMGKSMVVPPVVIKPTPSPQLKAFIADNARDHATEWVDRTYELDAGSRQVAIILVADKIEEIVNDPASGEYGFRRAMLYLEDCKFDHSKLVHTPREIGQVNFVGRP
jgi:hypothetical protein